MIFEDQVELAAFKQEDVLKTFQWVQQGHLRRDFLLCGEITWEGHNAYFDKVLTDSSQRVFAIRVNNVHVGNCGLKNLTATDAELWIYIGEKSMKGQGLGKKATQLLLSYAFNKMQLCLIYLHVAEFNQIARTMYAQLGFQENEQPISEEWSKHDCRVIRMELSKPI